MTSASSYSSLRIRRLNLAEPVILARSPIFTNKDFPLNFIVVALGLGRTGTDYFMNNKQDKDLCLLELWCKVEFVFYLYFLG
jgi:hypothetical protein